MPTVICRTKNCNLITWTNSFFPGVNHIKKVVNHDQSDLCVYMCCTPQFYNHRNQGHIGEGSKKKNFMCLRCLDLCKMMILRSTF